MRELTPEALDLVAERFKVLAEPMRLRILSCLRGGERTVTDIVETVDAGQANVSKHLGMLHRHGLVERRKEGLHVFYCIADPRVFELCELVCAGLENELETRRLALAGERE